MNLSGECLLFRESGESLGTHWCHMITEPDGRVWGHVVIRAEADDTFDRWFGIGRLRITMPVPQANPGAEPEILEPVAVWCRGTTQKVGDPLMHLLVSSDIPEIRVQRH